MKLFFAALAAGLVFLCGPVNAQLADFSAEAVSMQIGKSLITKVYVKNPDAEFANISVWLGGDYPAGLARFSEEEWVYFTADRRNATMGLNPGQERALSLVIVSANYMAGGYLITLNANTTASSLKSSDRISVSVDYPPSFPGLDFWAVLIITGLSGFVFWRIK